jgi:hypothetical protein
MSAEDISELAKGIPINPALGTRNLELFHSNGDLYDALMKFSTLEPVLIEALVSGNERRDGAGGVGIGPAEAENAAVAVTATARPPVVLLFGAFVTQFATSVVLAPLPTKS